MRAPSAPSRCPRCRRQQKKSTKNHVVCIDGTANANVLNTVTNVSKLFAKIDLESISPEQDAHNSGGTGDVVYQAFPRKLEKNIEDAYHWLAEKYGEGDQIYLFGFSRGAYQVRMLAAMIYEVGLITTSNKDKFEEAYDLYKSSCSGGQEARQAAREFKNRFCWKDMRVHFVGVWDTIGFLPQDVPLSRSSSAEHACHFRHALALDELRVKFMPEYFHEINSLEDFKYTDTSPKDKKATSSASELSGVSLNGKGSDIKEVWFAGSHSDVGGMNKTGRHHQPGNVSLLWMRREAAASGLVLKPTNIVWLPHDLDFGVTSSMTDVGRALEYVPTMHRVSNCGLGGKGLRLHQEQPRRIIPGQKIHASVLYAHAYKPKATLGDGFDIPIMLPGFEDVELDGEIWETGFFDASAAELLVNSLGMPQGVAPINLDKLLFMLRFREGRQSVRNIPDWQDKFMKLMNDNGSASVVRLVAIVAYHEASCDLEARPDSCASLCTRISDGVLLGANKCLKDVMDHHKHRDGPRVVALLRPLTKHRILRERILTEDILKTLVDSFDEVIGATEGHLVLAMDGLNCLLQCDDIRLAIVEKLRSNPPGDAMSRLSRILEAKDPLHLIAALRMVSILVRTPEGRAACSAVESKIEQLASKKEQLIGPLAAEICLALYDSDHPNQLNFRNANVRANFAGALLCLAQYPDLEREILFNISGFGATELTPRNKTFIGKLKVAALHEKNARERTAATITLLKLSKSTIIREHYREIKLLDIFVSQLRCKDSALLAALALAISLKYPDLEYIKDDNDFPEHIITMLREDYFDDAVGQFQGFQVLGELMQHADLRKRIISRDVIKILTDKLATSEEKATRCGLMCLDAFRSCEPQHPWTRELCDTGLGHLKDPVRKIQKAGANILSALAQTEHGVEAISARVPRIVEMLLPEGYMLIRRPTFPQTQGSLTSSDKPDAQKEDANTLSTPKSPSWFMRPVYALRDLAQNCNLGCSNTPSAQKESLLTPRSPSWMLGLAYALRILAQNATLRDCIFKTIQYGYVKELHQNGALVEQNDTSAWRWPLQTPNRDKVIHELDEMIDAVDLV